MALVQLFIPSEVGRSTISALGDLGAVQFRDVLRRLLDFRLMVFLVE